MNYPHRIICLSAESADWLWRIGAWDQVVGVTTYFEQPEEVDAKPKISGFNSANLNGIAQLKPDLIITFSDVQASLAESLIKNGFNVLATNQRTLNEIESTLALLARVVGKEERSEQLLKEFRAQLALVEPSTQWPRVYFEEWNDPLVTGIAWVSELIERAGGVDVFAEKRSQRAAADRTIRSEDVVDANPDIIIASWCGQPVDIESIANRPGWDQISAVKHNRIHEIHSNDILQPGFGLIDGFKKLRSMVGRI